MNAAVAATLRAERVVLGLSYPYLEGITGIPKTSLQRYFAGTRPLTIDTIALLADALGMSVLQTISEAERRLPMFTTDDAHPDPGPDDEPGHVPPSAEGIGSTRGPKVVVPELHPRRTRRTGTHSHGHNQ